jgi:uncharacterized protein YndB with AHSA1/START domain
MKLAIWVLAPLAGMVLLVILIGWMLPVAHVASASATLSEPADAVYAMVSDVASYPKWWSDMSRVDVLPAVEGRPRFRQHLGSDAVVIEVVEATAPTRFVTRIADPDQPFGGTWTLAIAPSTTGSTLTVTERGEVYNPVFRFVSRFVMGHTATINSFLQAVQRATG